ncbi:MAG TPA: M20/M25/M40 family metallo-hydrolase [Kofleriaceae bacterium]|jgi:acetylornithine deacetylase/succinyl-diaminopimelate desuccinylase-like protein|nr:M20/M25/M40 family metallo-hydrolase [Kofleriaceae bacterium]
MTLATQAAPALAPLGDEARRLCQALLRMDTTNPPGNERICADYLAASLTEVGYRPELIEPAPGRANLIVRHRGTGARPPLLLTAHLDVVEADPSGWQRPPFSGDEHEGCLWGRGAIDMKNMAAMCTAVMRRLAATQAKLSRDVIFAAVADEEAGCEHGSKFLVEHHRSKVEAEFAIGESGGFSLHVGETTFYPVQVAEKGLCWIRARVTGTPGHGSMPRADSAVTRLGEALAALGKAQLPVHPTKYVADFLDALRARQPALIQPLVRLLTRPRMLARIARLVPGAQAMRGLAPLLSNTASATVVRAGNKTNVIPGVAEFEIDGRTLPGQTDDDLLRELRAVLGPEVELEVVRSAPATVTEPFESPVYEAIKHQVEAREPGAVVVPYMIPGFTDAKYFSQMGARWYGFSPVKIERDAGIRFADMFHGNDERVPVAGLMWGAEVLDAVVREICA